MLQCSTRTAVQLCCATQQQLQQQQRSRPYFDCRPRQCHAHACFTCEPTTTVSVLCACVCNNIVTRAACGCSSCVWVLPAMRVAAEQRERACVRGYYLRACALFACVRTRTHSSNKTKSTTSVDACVRRVRPVCNSSMCVLLSAEHTCFNRKGANMCAATGKKQVYVLPLCALPCSRCNSKRSREASVRACLLDSTLKYQIFMVADPFWAYFRVK